MGESGQEQSLRGSPFDFYLKHNIGYDLPTTFEPWPYSLTRRDVRIIAQDPSSLYLQLLRGPQSRKHHFGTSQIYDVFLNPAGQSVALRARPVDSPSLAGIAVLKEDSGVTSFCSEVEGLVVDVNSRDLSKVHVQYNQNGELSVFTIYAPVFLPEEVDRLQREGDTHPSTIEFVNEGPASLFWNGKSRPEDLQLGQDFGYRGTKWRIDKLENGDYRIVTQDTQTDGQMILVIKGSVDKNLYDTVLKDGSQYWRELFADKRPEAITYERPIRLSIVSPRIVE